MMDSRDSPSPLTPSIVISPADVCLKDDFNNLYTSLAISIKQTTTTTTSSSHGAYEYQTTETEVTHYSSSSEPSLSPEKTAQSQTSSPTFVAEDVISAKSDPGVNCTPSSPTAASSASPASPAAESAPETSPPAEEADTAVISRPARRKVRKDSASTPQAEAGASVPFEIYSTASEPPAESNDQARSASSASGWDLQALLSSSPPNNTPSPSNSSRPAVHVGLVNQAMTCYLNSLIQALYMTPEFRNALYKWEFTGSNDEELHSIPYHLQKLFLNLQTSQRTAVETTKLTRSFGWDSSEAWNQHDIQELCRVMFEALERKFANTDQQDFIQRLYEGKMIDYVKCLECCKEKSRKDSFLDIPLPVKPFGNLVAYETIEEALDGFVEAETLDGNNQYLCETCNKKCDAQKGLKFSHFPYILTLHLKRFDFDYNTMHRIKLNDEVTFPEVLNLNDYIGSYNGEMCSDTNTASAMSDLNSTCSTNGDGGGPSEVCCCSDTDEAIDETTKSASKNCPIHKNEINRGSPGPFKYELFSIMIHSGSAAGGHYFAYIKDFDTNEWFCFNDDVVSPISHEDIVENFCSKNKNRYSVGYSTPYMLMYRQIDQQKNASFMKAEEFPDHIKKLVEVVQKEDEAQQSRRIMRRRPLRDLYNDSENTRSRNKEDEDDRLSEAQRDDEDQPRRIMGRPRNRLRNTDDGQDDQDDQFFVRVDFDQGGGEKKARRLAYTADETLGDFISVAAAVFNLSDVRPEKLRLAVYTSGDVPIVQEIEADSRDRFEPLLPKNSEFNLMLFVREESLQAGAVPVQIVSLDSLERIGLPIDVEYSKGMTIRALKEKLINFIGETPLNQIFIITNRGFARTTFNDDETVQMARATCPMFYAAFSQTREIDSKDALAGLTAIVSREVVEIKCKFVGISRDLLTRFGKNAREISMSGWRKKTTSVSNGINGDSSGGQNGWIDSPKTSDEKDGGAANIDLKSIARSAVEDQSLVTNGTSIENGSKAPPGSVPVISNDEEKESRSDDIITVLHVHDDDTELTLSVGTEMRVSTFKSMVAQFVGLPTDYIKLYNHPKDRKECGLSSFPIGGLPKSTLSNLCVQVVKPRATHGTIYWKIHKLDPKSWVAVYLFDCGMSKSITVTQAKKIILEEMQERGFETLPLERCRLREVMGSRPKNVFLDSLTLRELYSTSYDILVQHREGPEVVENGFQFLVMVRNFDNREDDPVKELVLDDVSSTNPTPGAQVEALFEKLSVETGIPVDSLDVRILHLSSSYYWNWRVEDLEDNTSHKLIDSGHAFYYRNKMIPIEDEVVQKLWDSYMPVRDYLERSLKNENGTSAEKSSENGEGKSKRRSGRKSNGAAAGHDDSQPKQEQDGAASSASDNNSAESPSPSEVARGTPVVSYRSKERGLKIYVEPTPPQRSTPEPTAPQENHKEVAAEEGRK